MAKYSFKSSGKTRDQVTQEREATEPEPLPIGIKTPLRFGKKQIFDMHYELADQVNDNLRNLILTNWGERLGLYDYGANLRELTTELVSQDDFDTQAIERIRTAVNKWMSYVDLEDFESRTNRTENQITGVIDLFITYNIPNLSVFKKKLQVTLYVI